MNDDRGLYYYPNPGDTRSRVYVRQGAEGIEFRLWHADYPAVWEKHAWVPQAALEAAVAMYRQSGKAGNPMNLYDVAVATVLLREQARREEMSGHV